MGDQIPGLPGDKTIRFGVVDLAEGHRPNERLEVLGRHLTVGGHHARDVDVALDCTLVAGHDRRPDTLVLLVPDHLDTRVTSGGALGRVVSRCVVDDHDVVDERGDLGNSRADQPFFVVGRHDHRD